MNSFIEPLEQRSLLAADYIISFYGLGGSGSFGADWLDKTVDDAGAETGAVVRKYDQNESGRALKDFFRAVDRNHNLRIDKREVASLDVRVIGYSFGAIEATNFTRYLLKVGQTIKGYLIGQATPIDTLVTYDPVDDPLAKHTLGVPNNVYNFANYYQQHGGDTTINIYTRTTPRIKVDTEKVEDPLDIKGEELPSEARRRTKQIRVDVGELGDETVRHKIHSNLDGDLKGSNVNHGTLPFFAYDLAIEDLTT
jgi:hypothetical protein